MIYTASSQYRDFGPDRLQDGRGWLSDVNDLNAWIGVEFEEPVEAVEIVNGFCEFSDKRDWKWHARVATARFQGGADFILKDTMMPQVVALPEKKTFLRMEIVSVHPSERFNVVGMMRLAPK